MAGFLLEVLSTPGAVNIDSVRAEQTVSAKQWLALIVKGEFDVQQNNARLSPDAVIHGGNGNGKDASSSRTEPCFDESGYGAGAGAEPATRSGSVAGSGADPSQLAD